MSQDNTQPIDIFNISSYIEYKIEITRLERREHYNRIGVRGINQSVEDLVEKGFQVARVQSFDDNTLLPIPDQVEIYTRLLHK